MIDFMHSVTVVMAVTEESVRKSKKEYREQEALRRSSMTRDERSYEDTCKFMKRLSRM